VLTKTFPNLPEAALMKGGEPDQESPFYLSGSRDCMKGNLPSLKGD